MMFDQFLASEAFLSINLDKTAISSGVKSQWHNDSTADFYMFSSPSGLVALRRRSSYPVTFAQCRGSVLEIGYGDSAAAHKVAIGEGRDEVLQSEEFLHIAIDCNEKSVVIQRDVFCTVPIFVAYTDNKIVISNLFDVTCSALNGTELRLSKSKLQDFFTGKIKENFDTYIDNCIPLGGLENIIWQNGQLTRTRKSTSISYTPGNNVYEGNPRLFRQYFDDLLAEYVEKYADSQPIACEFSGGIDSAMIAGRLADIGRKPLLFTVRYPGQFRSTQQQKIQDFSQRFRSRQSIVDLDVKTLFPLSRMHLSNTWKPVYREEIYFEPFYAHAKDLIRKGMDVSFNGLSGDDALARFDFPRPQYLVPSFFTCAFAQSFPLDVTAPEVSSFARVSNQLVKQKMSHNNCYLGYGVWPIAPYTNPHLLSYCQSLKPRFKHNKAIYRAYCQAWQYPRSIYQPTVNEDYGPFFEQSAKLYFKEFARKWLTNSVLAKFGLINKKQAIDYVSNSQTHEEYFQTYQLITVEATLQILNISSLSD